MTTDQVLNVIISGRNPLDALEVFFFSLKYNTLDVSDCHAVPWSLHLSRCISVIKIFFKIDP